MKLISLDIEQFVARCKVMFNSGAWMLILFGLALFTIRIPMENTGWINWPVAATVFQTAGLMFMLFGFQIWASMIVWPTLKISELMREIMLEKNSAAGHAILGLLIFNGLSLVAFTIWLTGALGAGVLAK